jgi:chromosomal replication initiator protein
MLTGPGKQRRVAEARQVAMYVLRHAYGMPSSEIATALGRRNHTTALHGIARIDEMMGRDAEFSAVIQRLVDGARRSADRGGWLRVERILDRHRGG